MRDPKWQMNELKKKLDRLTADLEFVGALKVLDEGQAERKEAAKAKIATTRRVIQGQYLAACTAWARR